MKKIDWKSVEEPVVRMKFTILLFVCSILVIYIHANNLADMQVGSTPSFLDKLAIGIENYWVGVTKVAVPFFFMISGFLFFRTFSINKLLQKWGGRFRTVVIPYIIWCTLYFLYYVIVTHVPAARSIMSDASVVDLTFLNWFRYVVIEEYYTLWFLKNLILFILLTPCFYYLLRNYSRSIPTGFVVLVAALVFIHFRKEFGVDLGFAIPSGIDVYMVGAYLGINHKEWITKSNRTISIFSFVIVCLFFLTAFRWFSIPFNFIFFIACWYALDLLHIKKTYWWMEITFFTYVAHDMPLEALKKLYTIAFGSFSVTSLVEYLFLPIVIEVLLIGIAFLLIKYLPQFWTIVCGGRLPKIETYRNRGQLAN